MSERTVALLNANVNVLNPTDLGDPLMRLERQGLVGFAAWLETHLPQ